MLKIALASSAEPKDWYVDISLLIDAFAACGVKASLETWGDPDVSWRSYNAVIVHSTWDYAERYSEFMQWCSYVSDSTRLINDLETIMLSSDKRYLLELQTAGIRTPQTVIVPKSSAELAPAKTFSGEVVVKPLIGAGGGNTHRFADTVTALQSPIYSELHKSHDLLVQNYVPEIQTLGEYSAVFIGGKLSHCVIKIPTGNEFRVQFDYGGTTAICDAPGFTKPYYDRIMKALGRNPIYARIDFIVAIEPVLMEVEMVEPDMFLRLFPDGARTLAHTITQQMVKN